MAAGSARRWAEVGGPGRKPSSYRGSFGGSARQFVVTESFETCEGVGDVVLAHAAVELLCPSDARRPPKSRRERPEVSEVPSLRAVEDREYLAGGKVLGGESWNAIDLLQWEQWWGVDGEVDLDGLTVERRQESGEGDVVSDEMNGPSLGGERGAERCCERAHVAGRVARLRCYERVEVAGQPVDYAKRDEGRPAGEREAI